MKKLPFHIILLQMLARGKGRVVTLCVSVVTWVITYLSTRYAWNIEPGAQSEMVLWISTAVAGLVGWLIDAGVAYYATDGTAENQKELQKVDPSVVVDGVSGPTTQASVRSLVNQVEGSVNSND